jgi:glycosyltransferase involved in cell wall biosynthesis
MAREERMWCPRVTLNTAVSWEDRETFERMIPTARFTVVPNGVDADEFRPAAESNPADGGIVFVGGYSWFPNRDALSHFCEDILPHLRQRGRAVPVSWVGRAPEAVQQEYRELYGVELTGYVEAIQPYVHSAACYVVPLRVGGGTRLKILDAWAMGKAVVSTSAGCEGLEARDGENILIRDDPEEFAAAIQQVLGDGELRARLGRNARRTAEDVYSWDVIGEAMIRDYRGLVGLGSTKSGAVPTGSV